MTIIRSKDQRDDLTGKITLVAIRLDWRGSGQEEGDQSEGCQEGSREWRYRQPTPVGRGGPELRCLAAGRRDAIPAWVLLHIARIERPGAFDVLEPSQQPMSSLCHIFQTFLIPEYILTESK